MIAEVIGLLKSCICCSNFKYFLRNGQWSCLPKYILLKLTILNQFKTGLKNTFMNASPSLSVDTTEWLKCVSRFKPVSVYEGFLSDTVNIPGVRNKVSTRDQ